MTASAGSTASEAAASPVHQVMIDVWTLVLVLLSQADSGAGLQGICLLSIKSVLAARKQQAAG